MCTIQFLPWKVSPNFSLTSHGLSLSRPLLSAEGATALELVAKLEISLNQVPRFSRSGRTGSGFHITWPGTGSLRYSSFFIITQTGRFMDSGLGVRRVGNAGGQILHELVTFVACKLLMGQLMFGGYSGFVLYNRANSAAIFDSSGCRNGWYRYGSGGNRLLDSFRCSDSWLSNGGKPAALEMGGNRDRWRFPLSIVGEISGEIEKPNLDSFFSSGFGFRLGRYL